MGSHEKLKGDCKMDKTNLQLNHYAILAPVYAYPGQDFNLHLLTAQEFLDEYHTEAAGLLRPFTAYMSALPLLKQQELFVRSFDVQAVTTLDVGYVLFGDDYKRGELLVNLNREHREAQNDCGIELPDHLSNILRLLPKMKDKEIARELVEKIVAVALKRMILSFAPEQMQMRDEFYQKKFKTLIERPAENYLIYVKALEGLYTLLKYDFGFAEVVLPEHHSDFLKNLQTEVSIEDKHSK